jgi:hypothetical protein
VASGQRPDSTVEQMLETLARDGAVDVHGYALHRTVVDSLAGVDLSGTLDTFRGPLLLAQIQTRGKLSPPNAALAATLESRGQIVTTACVAEEPGWHYISNPAWESDALANATTEWIRGLA